MSTQPDLKGKLQNRAERGAGVARVEDTFQGLIGQASIKKRFEEILGQRAPGFMSSVLAVVNGNPMLREADPQSILAASAIAASLDLPVDPNLGFAAIVPYREDGRSRAQFQMMTKGYVQLAMRTGQYRLVNVAEVYEGEIKRVDRITGEIEFDYAAKKSDKVIGYAAFFRLLNGFEHTEYMTVEQIHAHARRYSKSYGKPYSPWTVNAPAMERKTVLKRLISRWGIMSIQMQTAVLADQAVVNETPEGPQFDYVDSTAVGSDEHAIQSGEPTTEAQIAADLAGDGEVPA